MDFRNICCQGDSRPIFNCSDRQVYIGEHSFPVEPEWKIFRKECDKVIGEFLGESVRIYTNSPTLSKCSIEKLQKADEYQATLLVNHRDAVAIVKKFPLFSGQIFICDTKDGIRRVS